jgi:hypothetical protein
MALALCVGSTAPGNLSNRPYKLDEVSFNLHADHVHILKFQDEGDTLKGYGNYTYN